MSINCFRNVRNVTLAILAGAWAAIGGSTPVYAQHNHMMHMGQQASPSAQQPKTQPSTTKQPAVPPPGPHGGRMSTTASAAFEVLYLPQEIRVYIYGPTRKPQSARGVDGEITIRRRNETRTYTATLKYVAPAPGSSEQDYLAVGAKLGGAKDGDMAARFNLTNLPLERPTATFGQPVAVSKPKPQVTLAALEESDKAGIASQKVCPVTGAGLGSMGSPVKVLVGAQPLYLCCKGCLGRVQSDPEAYLPKATQTSQGK